MLGKGLLLVVCLFLVIEFGNGSSQTIKTSKIPKDLFITMNQLTMKSTADMLKTLSPRMYKDAIRNNRLPSRNRLTGRNLGSKAVKDIINVENQECQPRPELVKLLQPPETESAFNWPVLIQLPRCNGYCNIEKDVLHCIVTNTSKLIIPAYKVTYYDSRKRRDVIEEFANREDPVHRITKRSLSTHVQPFFTTVSIDTKCECKCKVTKAYCTSLNKTFNEDFCRCECPTKPTCPIDRQWDEDKCSCVCIGDPDQNVKTCLSNFYSSKAYWNTETCSCACRPCRVDPFIVQDPKTCECKCTKICDSRKRLRLVRKTCQCIRRRG